MLREMRSGKVYKTSQISRGEFGHYFSQLYQKDPEATYIYVCFSSGLTKIFESAVLALEDVKQEYPNFKLDIIDTKCATLGYGLAVIKAAELVELNTEKEEIIEKVNQYASKIRHIFTVDDLAYLYRGGRLTKTSYYVGNMLNVKPVLHLDNQDGKLYPYRKTRGTKKMMQEIIKIMKEEGHDISSQRIAIGHGDDQEKVNQIKEMIVKEFGEIEIIENVIGCAVRARNAGRII